MKNFIIILLSICLISCKNESVPFDQETSDIINTFYSDALEKRESYELLRVLSKDIGARPSGSEGAKKAVLWSKKVMEDYGFDTVYLQEVMVPHWERGELEEAYFYNGKDKINLSILGAGGTVSTPTEGITAEVVEVASLDEVDELGRENIEGKIVLGGIQGGISNGEDIYFNVAFKPVSTIMKDQNSIDSEKKEIVVKGKGRHDPCVVPRAVPIVESMAANVLVDLYLQSNK